MPNLWTAQEFAEKWKVSAAFVYQCIKEGMPVKCQSPVRLGDEADAWFENRPRPKDQKKEG